MPDDIAISISRGADAGGGPPARSFEIVLEEAAGIAFDAALAAFVDRGWAELVAARHAAPDAEPHAEGDRLLVAREPGGRPIGILAFRHISRPARTFIAFGYVCPDSRRRGVYSRLYVRLVAEARAAGSAAIESEAYPDNEAILAVARGQGRTVSRLILQSKL